MREHGTIALLPFEAPTGEVPGYLVRGIVQDVAAELARFAQLDVVHPDSGAAARAQHRDPDALGSALGADWLVTGSVVGGGGDLAVQATLVEVPGARQLWSERLTSTAGPQRVEGQLIEAIAAQLAQRIDDRRLLRARRRAEADLAAYDLWLRGMETLRGGTIEDDRRARSLFAKALDREPHFARAHAGMSLSYFNDWSCQSWERWDENAAHALEHARRAVELDDDDHVSHMILGRILEYQREFDLALRHIDLSLALNANDADTLMQLALCVAMLGDGPRAHELCDRGMRLHPMHPDWYYGYAALACLITREVERGIELARRAWGAAVDLPAHVAVAYAHLGDLESARRHMEIFRRDFEEKITFGRPPEPGEALRWLLHVNPFARQEDIAYLVEGMRHAGLEEDPDAGRVSTTSPPREDAGAVLRCRGDVWTLGWRGSTVELRTVKGFHDLARLIEAGGEPVHCLTLTGAPLPAHDGDPLLDDRAKREVEERIRELQAELDRAEADADLGRAEAAREELDRLVESLAQSLGLGGRRRKLGNAAEKARSAVTWRIRSAIGRISDAHPELGRHLRNSVRTGAWCSYTPERPVDWQL